MSQADENRLLEEAGERGVTAGRNAASWVFDGNTTEATYRRVLRMLEDGDPAIESFVSEPAWLSGEWAGESIPEILGDLVEEAEELGLENFADELMEKYEDEAHHEFWFVVEADAARAVEGFDAEFEEDEEDEEFEDDE